MAISTVSGANEGSSAFYSSVTGQTYATQDEAQKAETAATGGDLTGGANASAPVTDRPTAEQSWDAGRQGQKYVRQGNGSWSLVPMSDAEKMDQQKSDQTLSTNQGTSASPQDPNQNPADIVAQTRDQLGLNAPARPAIPDARGGAPTAPVVRAPRAVVAPPTPGVDPGAFGNTDAYHNSLSTAGAPAANPNAPTGAPAPQVDTSASDKSVSGVNNTINQLVQLANTSPGTSAAEAQLEKSDQLAKLRAVDELRNNQAASLGAARSSRNRADAGVLERSAVGESAYLGTKAQNQDVLRQAELEGNQAILRATEDTNDKNSRANILAKAADLGLNVAALQVDVSKADLGSINNYINDQFQQLGIDKQVGAQEMGQILSFSQAMSAIKYDYDKMADADKEHTLDLMMQQYGIDANTQVAMKQIQANHKGTLEKIFDGVLGAAAAATPVVGNLIAAGAKK